MNRNDCAALDAADPLASLREQFTLPAELIYLDGNSLGALPKAAALALQCATLQQWGDGLIRSWNDAGWIDLPNRLGDKIATLIGGKAGEVVCADSTSINLYKVLFAALQIQLAHAGGQTSTRNVVLSERENFPTDLYIAQSLCTQLGFELRLCESESVKQSMDSSTAVVMLTHVNYRSGAAHDMAQINAQAARAGALTVWDLAHSAGAMPIGLHADGADFAVGCGYKYLNGGPGAPAFVWAHPKHHARLAQPLTGWLGHAQPFDFAAQYQPAAGVQRLVCGTPPVLSMVALDCGVDTLLAAQPFGGMPALRQKSLALTQLFMQLLRARCAQYGVRIVTPMTEHRGSHVSFAIDGELDRYAVMQAVIARGVIGDFRAGGTPADGLLRFGFAPLYNRFEDVWLAVDAIADVLQNASWNDARYLSRATVT
jgi:kynureninase